MCEIFIFLVVLLLASKTNSVDLLQGKNDQASEAETQSLYFSTGPLSPPLLVEHKITLPDIASQSFFHPNNNLHGFLACFLKGQKLVRRGFTTINAIQLMLNTTHR